MCYEMHGTRVYKIRLVLQYSHKIQWDKPKKNFDRHSTRIKVSNVLNGFSFPLSYMLSLHC